MPAPRIRSRLTAHRLRELLDYDRSTGVFTWRLDRGRLARAGARAGCVRKDGMLTITIDGKQFLGNRLAWFHVYGELPKGRLTAADHDLTNTRWSNILLESETLSATRAAAYQREYRRRKNFMDAGLPYNPLRHHDPLDPRDPRNETIYEPAKRRGRKRRF